MESVGVGMVGRARAWFSALQRELTLSEISGAMGDLGTFLPLVVGLVSQVGLDLGATLVATGLYNVVTGIHFGIPMPVQPMKTVSAVALSDEPLDVPEIMVAGLGVSLTVLFLGMTGLMAHFNRFVPMPLVRGIQLGVGLKLGIKGAGMVLYKSAADRDWRDWWGIEGLVLGISGFVFIIFSALPQQETSAEGLESPLTGGKEHSKASLLVKAAESHKPLREGSGDVESTTEGTKSQDIESVDVSLPKAVSSRKRCSGSTQSNWPSPCSGASKNGRRIPAALILVILGVLLTVSFNPSVLKSLSFGPSKVKIIIPTWHQVKTGLLRAGLPQLPLTTLNSVVAVCALSYDLFPDRPANPNSVAFSVGMMNVIGTWFGAMPSCHGAGGLAAQARFGARTGTAPVFLGLVKIALGLLFGSSLFSLLQQFPEVLLGSMLVFSGVELAGCCRTETRPRGVALMLITAVAIFATKNTAIGFGVGTVTFVVAKVGDLALLEWLNWKKRSAGGDDALSTSLSNLPPVPVVGC